MSAYYVTYFSLLDAHQLEIRFFYKNNLKPEQIFTSDKLLIDIGGVPFKLGGGYKLIFIDKTNKKVLFEQYPNGEWRKRVVKDVFETLKKEAPDFICLRNFKYER